MKKFLILFFLVSSAICIIQAQTAKLSFLNGEKQSGDTLRVGLIAENITNVGAISLKILYDKEKSEYIGLENGILDFLSNSNDSVITIGWFDMTAKNPVNLSNERIFDLVLLQKKSEGRISFIKSGCEISNSSGEPITVDYVDNPK